MAGNTTVIDEVVDPIAVKQFNDLATASKAATDSMVAALKVAIELNAVTGGSTVATFTKNAKASTDATNTLIANQQKVLDIEAKKQQLQEATINKYLILLSRQQAERDKADAKEIAAAEAKATKLQAIAEKQAAKQSAIQSRKDNAQFPTGDGYVPSIARDDSPAVRYEPIITGNEDMAIVANKSTEAIAAENASLAEQKEVLDSLSTSYRANIELLLELQVERAANAAELKELTVADAASGERAVFLTAEQLRLKTAIQQTNLTLSQQTKQMLSADTSAAQAQAQLDELRTAYSNLSTAEKENIEVGGVWLAEIQRLDAAVKENSASMGVHNKEVSNYALAQGKATTATVLAEKVSAQFVRQLVRMAAQFLLITVVIGAVTWLYDYIKALDIFNPVASEAEMRQKALVEAFASSDYSKAIESTEKLAANLDLAKKGFADSDSVINEYNETIGKTFGFVDNLNDAQKGFIDNAPDFIRAATLEAAAQVLLADSAKSMAETMAKNQVIQNKIDDVKNRTLKNNLGQQIFTDPTNKLQEQERKAAIANGEKEIAENKKREEEKYRNSLKGIENFYTEKDTIEKKHGVKSNGINGEQDAIATLRTQLANQPLELQKQQAQEIIKDEKQTYAARLKAVQDFYEASYKIANNNEILATNGIKLSNFQKEKLVGDFNNTVTQLQIARDEQAKNLNEKKYKQDQEILKNDIQTQKDIFKSITDDPNQSFQVKITALSLYNSRSLDLIKANYNEQIKEAGKNTESIKLAKQALAKSELELTNEIEDKTLKIQKEASEKLKSELENLLRFNENAEKLALQALSDLNDKQLSIIQDQADKELAVVADKYSKHKISEKKYQNEITQIQDQANVDRLGQEAFYAQSILEIKQAAENVAISNLQGQGGQAAIDKVKANSGVGEAQKNVDKAGRALQAGLNKQTQDGAKGGKDKNSTVNSAYDFAIGAQDAIRDLVDKNAENQIAKLELVAKKVEENANAEKAAVERGMDTQSNKARRIAEIDAQTASQKAAIQAKENQLKNKEAKADKAASIAKIVEGIAVGIIENGIITPTAALAAALGAVQLGVALGVQVPTFAKGTGTGATQGGLVIYGEKGPELIQEPNRPAYYSPGVATIANLPKGTKITPHHMLPETPSWTSNRTDNSDVVAAVNENTAAIKKQQPKKQQRMSGWLNEQRKADVWGNYSYNHFK